MVVVKKIIDSSFVDYPDKVAMVIFTAGCNFKCHYCHNPELVNPEPPFMSEEMVIRKINSKKEWIEGVVITGGEPTLHTDLPEFIRKIKSLGLLVKLDTNGSKPAVIRQLIEEGLIDYISMDVKAPLDRYKDVTQVDVDISKIKESINIIRESGVPYEFKTTILPSLIKEKDLLQIGYLLEGSDTFVIQKFRNEITLDEEYRRQPTYIEPELEHFVRMMKPFFKRVILR